MNMAAILEKNDNDEKIKNTLPVCQKSANEI